MTEATTAKKPARKAPAKKALSAPKAAKKADKGLFAIIATGGKQYRVSAGDRVKIEKLPGTFAVGDAVTFSNVLLTSNGSEVSLGNPFLSGSSVTGTLTKIARNKTIDVIKYKQKSRYFKKYGHRQPYFEVEIDSIK